MFFLERCEIYLKRYFKDFLNKGSFGQFLLNQKKAIFILLVSFYGFSASAEPGHIPKKMPVVKAELVGMSTEGLNRIDELMQEHMNLGHIQGGVTVVARRGRVVHFSTHGEMDSNNGLTLINARREPSRETKIPMVLYYPKPHFHNEKTPIANCISYRVFSETFTSPR